MKHFHRSMALAVALSAILRDAGLSHIERQQKLNSVPDYYSRGKGGRKTPRTFSGVARARRAAQKARNKAA
jgi:hypothetical protein